jgi:hypothetical protein
MADIQLQTLKGVDLSGRKATSPLRETSDIESGQVWLGRDGSIVTMDWYTAMALEGRVFNVALAAPDGVMTGATAYDPTHPSILIDVPEGAVFIPVHVDICYEDASSTDNYIIIGCEDINTYVSGGTAISACNNLRTDNPYASAITSKYCSDSAITATDPAVSERILFSYVNAFLDATTSPPMQVVWEPKSPPVLVGPASFFAYCYGAAAPEFSFSIQWVELPKSAVV